jgi:hypothetical protein
MKTTDASCCLPHARRLGRVLALLAFAALAGCAQTKSFKTETATNYKGSVQRVLLMPVDVELAELTASGLLEPNAEWTEQGSRNVTEALRGELAERNSELVIYEAVDDPLRKVAPEHEQVFKLHQAVGRSILIHKYVQGFELPTKKDRFDWTLGKGARVIRDATGVDHALFVYARDSFTSAGRAALIFTAALFGVSVPGGHTEAFASLVDLETGDIVWFNIMVTGVGDLREPESATTAIDSLLSDVPL